MATRKPKPASAAQDTLKHRTRSSLKPAGRLRPSLPRKAKENAETQSAEQLTVAEKKLKSPVPKSKSKSAPRSKPNSKPGAKPEPTPPAQDPKTLTCVTCYTAMDARLFPDLDIYPSVCQEHLANPQHRTCRSCVNYQCQYQSTNFGGICCYDCGSAWDLEMLTNFLTPNEITKLEERMSARVYEQDEAFHWCSQDKCTSGQLHDLELVAKDPKVCCAECKAVNCFDCRVPWHEGLTCKEHSNKERQVDGVSDNVNKMRENKTRRCPNCRTAVEHAMGCNHMYCIVCEHDFMWEDATEV